MRKTKQIAQANSLTHARYTMTPSEKNLMYVLMSKLGKSDPIDKDYTITVKELEEMTGEKMNYQQAKEVSKLIMSRHILLDGKEDEEFRRVSFIDSFEYSKGTITVTIPRKMRPLFFELKSHFTEITLADALGLKGVHSKRFYEFFCSWVQKGVYKTTVGDLKASLGLGDKYPRWGDFEKRVILPSLKEVNEKTPMTVSVAMRRKGRTPHYLSFRITGNVPVQVKPKASGQGFADWQIERMSVALDEKQQSTVRHHGKNAFRDLKDNGNPVKNSGLFWAEFAEGFCKAHYKIELGLLKTEKRYFNFDWAVYKPTKK